MYAKVEERNKLKSWYDLWFDDHKRAGYVAVTDFKRQYFYGSNDIKKILDATEGKNDLYISLNAFNVDWKNKVFSREATQLKQIRNIAVDIDQYELGITISEALDEIQALIFENKIPEPNLILTSRGIQLFYSIYRGASPKMDWLREYITKQLIGKLGHIGADYNAVDVSRVMRVPNTINTRNNSIVKPEIWYDTPYTLDELQAYCRPLNRTRWNKKKSGKVIPLKNYKKVSTIYKINHSRLKDFNKLIELRNGNFTGMRNVFLYMYAYHESLIHDTQDNTIKAVEQVYNSIYSTTDKPMSRAEFERTVKSAHNDAREFFEHFINNNYTIIYKGNDGIIKPYKVSTIIEKLDIKEHEQMQMNTLHSPEIKREKDIKRLERKRRAKGMRTMEQYNKQRKQRKQAKIDELRQLLKDKPNATNKELTTKLNISLSTLQRYKRTLSNQCF